MMSSCWGAQAASRTGPPQSQTARQGPPHAQRETNKAPLAEQIPGDRSGSSAGPPQTCHAGPGHAWKRDARPRALGAALVRTAHRPSLAPASHGTGRASAFWGRGMGRSRVKQQSPVVWGGSGAGNGCRHARALAPSDPSDRVSPVLLSAPPLHSTACPAYYYQPMRQQTVGPPRYRTMKVWEPEKRKPRTCSSVKQR